MDLRHVCHLVAESLKLGGGTLLGDDAEVVDAHVALVSEEAGAVWLTVEGRAYQVVIRERKRRTDRPGEIEYRRVRLPRPFRHGAIEITAWSSFSAGRRRRPRSSTSGASAGAASRSPGTSPSARAATCRHTTCACLGSRVTWPIWRSPSTCSWLARHRRWAMGFAASANESREQENRQVLRLSLVASRPQQVSSRTGLRHRTSPARKIASHSMTPAPRFPIRCAACWNLASGTVHA
jgi:hypothetical protein